MGHQVTALRVSDTIPQVVFLAPIITNPAPVGIDWKTFVTEARS